MNIVKIPLHYSRISAFPKFGSSTQAVKTHSIGIREIHIRPSSDMMDDIIQQFTHAINEGNLPHTVIYKGLKPALTKMLGPHDLFHPDKFANNLFERLLEYKFVRDQLKSGLTLVVYVFKPAKASHHKEEKYYIGNAQGKAKKEIKSRAFEQLLHTWPEFTNLIVQHRRSRVRPIYIVGLAKNS